MNTQRNSGLRHNVGRMGYAIALLVVQIVRRFRLIKPCLIVARIVSRFFLGA